MTPERWQQIKRVLQSALDHQPDQRAAFLTQACGGDLELQQEVQLLLAHQDSTEEMAWPAWPWLNAAAADAGNSVRALPPAVGRYRILRVVGEGGMGTVYEAEQDQPRRIVALKVIRPGLAGSELLRRFERESQLLARLQHSGIAQIYEAGAADSGAGPQPYFAMEFIHGAPLRDYCEKDQLNTRQRMELIAKICDAVEHAHQRGIIHRDLKPGNILVDESGQPKILDFGVARTTESDTQVTKQTDVGQLIGTLAYMSPEQVAADPLDLDTRSDVYALGVILYELLANRLPYQLSHQLPEAVRTIREEDPSRLSSINRAYRGDVETVVAKALEKDKTRRYPSAAALATDIRRYLADEPILARPASTSYQLRKFARRHRTLVSAIAAVFVVLIVGVVVSTTEAVRARRAEQTAQAVNDFLQNDLLAQASANTQASAKTKPDPDLKVRTALDRAAAKIAGKFGRQPEVEASVRDTIGQTYLDLGLFREAEAQFSQARDLYVRVLGPESEKTLEAMSRLGYTYFVQGRYPEAEALLTRTVEAERRVLGPEHKSTLYSMNALATVYQSRGNYEKAEALGRQVLEIRRRILSPQDLNTLTSMNNLAIVYYREGKYPQAVELYRQGLDIERRVLGPEHPDTLSSISNLGVAYLAQGDYARAEEFDRQALDLRRHALGPEHPATLLSMSNLAVVYGAEGKFAEAAALDAQIVDLRRRVLGAEHPDTLMSINNLGHDDLMAGKYEQAKDIDSRLLEIRQRVLGAEHPDTLMSMDNLSFDYAAMQNYPQAEALFAKTLEISKRALGPEHPQTLSVVADFASALLRERKFAQAQQYAAQALAGRRRALGGAHPDTIGSAIDLALAYESEDRFVEAEPLAREALTFNRKTQPDNWLCFLSESLLGASLAGQRKYTEAEPLLVEGYAGLTARKSLIDAPDLYYVTRSHDFLVRLYQAWGKPDKVAEWLKRKP